MALVTSLEPSNPKTRQSVHPTRTQCLYSIVEGSGDERYLQLDTVGSKNRVIPGKTSQSIQFDRQAAGQLLRVLRLAFPDLATNPDQGSPGEASTTSEVADDDEAIEGKLLLKKHLARERKPRLVRKKKRAVMRAEGRLLCEVCGFDFAAVYGALGDGFAECHHRTPLAHLNEATPTRLTDLAIVCANCHRMLHRRPIHSMDELRSIVRDRP